MNKKLIPASFFGMVLGLSGLGQAWRVGVTLWSVPAFIGESVLSLATLIWLSLLLRYIWQAIKHFDRVKEEFKHPIQGSTPALLGVSTLLIVLAIRPYSHTAAFILMLLGIAWHLCFALWHTGTLWQGGRNLIDTAPTLYLPTVAGNFTSAAALGALGYPQWGWLFLGAGVFSWLALESPIVQRLWLPDVLPIPQRPLIGIQFAPPVVCLMATLMLTTDMTSPWLLMLWGYGLFQLMLGIRLSRWLGEQSFAPSYWAYTFGIASTTVATLKLAKAGVFPAMTLALPIFIMANVFIGYLAIRTFYLFSCKKLV